MIQLFFLMTIYIYIYIAKRGKHRENLQQQVVRYKRNGKSYNQEKVNRESKQTKLQPERPNKHPQTLPNKNPHKVGPITKDSQTTTTKQTTGQGEPPTRKTSEAYAPSKH